MVQVLLIGNTGGLLDAVRVVQHHTQITDPAYAGLRTHGGLAGFNAGVAKDTLFGLAAFPVVINLLVGAARHTHAPATALVLVDQHNAVFLAFVDRARGARGHAGRVEAMLTQAWQIHHEGVFKLPDHLFLNLVKIGQVGIFAAFGELAAQNLLPIWTPLDFFHAFAGDQAARSCRGRGLGLWRRLQMVIVKGEGLVVVVNLRHVRVRENAHQQLPFAALARLDAAVRLAAPSTLPLVLVFPFLGVTDARLGLDVVEPGVLHAGSTGPDVLAGD